MRAVDDEPAGPGTAPRTARLMSRHRCPGQGRRVRGRSADCPLHHRPLRPGTCLGGACDRPGSVRRVRGRSANEVVPGLVEVEVAVPRLTAALR